MAVPSSASSASPLSAGSDAGSVSAASSASDVNAGAAGETGTSRVKRGMADMLKGGVIMDVVTPDQAKIAEDAGAVAVMALERVPGRHPGPGRRGQDE